LANTDNGCTEMRIEERLKALRLQAAWNLPCRYRAAKPSRAGFVQAWSGFEKAVCAHYLNPPSLALSSKATGSDIG
jgi:hypothetical protein